MHSCRNTGMFSSSSGAALGVTARVIAAAVGGYFLSMVCCLWLGDWLQLPGRDGRLLVNMLFFVIYLLVIMWCFAVRRHTTAIAGIALPTLLLFGLRWLDEGAAA